MGHTHGGGLQAALPPPPQNIEIKKNVCRQDVIKKSYVIFPSDNPANEIG